VLERGEKLDNLVERSNALSAQSKMFYKTAKKVSLDCCHALTCELIGSKTRVA
jgi:synaptobrevin family protein YKT6